MWNQIGTGVIVVLATLILNFLVGGKISPIKEDLDKDVKPKLEQNVTEIRGARESIIELNAKIQSLGEKVDLLIPGEVATLRSDLQKLTAQLSGLQEENKKTPPRKRASEKVCTAVARCARLVQVVLCGHSHYGVTLVATQRRPRMKLYNFDLLAYPTIPPEAPGTPIPSTFFDPAVGARNYREHLDEMVYCEDLGFEGVVFNEHHYSAYGTMPSPNLIAAALSQRTERMKIGILGNILPLRQHPVRVAEEYAMLDCLTDGRLIAGFVRGIPSEYLWYNVNPAESRARFGEAFEVIMTAWTQPIWSYAGDFFQFEHCAIWPRPVQQPHPPIWVAARSAESIQWCVERRLPIAQVYQTTEQIEDTFAYYRQLSQAAGWQAGPEQFILTRHIYVDETDAKARAVAEPALRYFFTLWNRGFNEAASHVAQAQHHIRAALHTEQSFDYFREGNRARVNFHPLSWDDLDTTGFIIAGSPDSVARKLQEQMRQVGAEHFMGMFHIGNLPHQAVLASLDRFHQHVMPALTPPA